MVKESRGNEFSLCRVQSNNCVLHPMDNEHVPNGTDISKTVVDGFMSEQWMALRSERDRAAGKRTDRLTYVSMPLKTHTYSQTTVTQENLQDAVYDPYFPLITASACTHSLSTPSIGTRILCVAHLSGWCRYHDI